MKSLLKDLTGFLPLLFMVVLINLISDPAQIYRKGYEKSAADIIVSGKNLAGATDCNERLLLEHIVLKEKERPDSLIIGSSRVLELSDETIPNLNSYRNLGLSGAGIYDFYGILGIYCEKKELPRKIIIGLDPWMLNENNGETRYKTLQKYIDVFEKNCGETKPNEGIPFSTEKLQLLSLSYFQSSVAKICANPNLIFEKITVDYYATTERIVDEPIKYADGSIDYSREYRDQTTEAVNDRSKSYVLGEVYQMEDFNEISPKYCALLDNILDYFEKNGIEVVFYLPPYHPYVYNYLIDSKEYCIINSVEQYFRKIAEDRNIEVFGSYNPARLNCTEDDFLDGMHMRRKDVHKTWVKCD